MSDPSFDNFTDAYAKEVETVGLQNSFDFYVKTLPHLPLPAKILNLSDFHAGDGGIDGHVDPFKNSGLELTVLDLLDFYQDYAWFISEILDFWRGRTYEAISKAHPGLTSRISQQKAKGLLYWVDSNHSRDVLALPKAFVFEGFGKKVYFDHGDMWDWPNCRGWKVGRMCVRAADELGIDPETSPTVTSADRHAKVVGLRDELARNNPTFQILYGHIHLFRHNGIDPKCFSNSWNSGSPITGKLQGYLIEEGVITPKDWA